ncbi:two-component sensor histidine kinase [Streptomyces virginiae]|uniref:histidine kinase n=2 Tax=Streptomyces virginiae TaxID=1961 RepID=A0ABQ3NNK0_STRVG|nr:two-component sensor histidine kinase [Streptomyces virginiae]GHI14343.1 two-component sensor histidine kinase [Streptomyces virginiae]
MPDTGWRPTVAEPSRLRGRVGGVLRSLPRAAACRWPVLRRLWPTTVRARATAGAGLVVGAALALASFSLLGLLEANLLRNAENDARRQAETVAQLAATGKLGRARPAGRAVEFVQVVSADGRVLFSSPNLIGVPAFPPAPPETPGTRLHTWRVRPVDGDHRQRVVQVVTQTPDGPATVYAGASLRDADAADDVTTAALVLGMPLLLATVVLVTWRVTGHALRPVEAIRAEVAGISDRDLHRRVPVPATHDEVARLAETMNATLDRLEASGIRQRQFIADASHELRSPITVLRTQLEVALAVRDPELWPELIGGALEDIERLQRLAADLLLLARIDAAQPVTAAPLDLGALVREVVEARLGDRVPVRVDLAADVVVTAGALWLGRVITNLVDNAQRYAERGVEVTLRTAGGGAGPRTAVLEVVDDGPGIPVADRERVFERFTRLDDSRSRDHGGAGLGLAIARDLSSHHGGTLTAQDGAGGGARLVLRLPLTPRSP